VTTTPQDFHGNGAAEGAVAPDNYDIWVYVFDRDRFAFTQESRGAGSWGYCKLTMWEHKMRWLFRDGDESAGTGATKRPNELFVFG
jgi:hypothetical protein